VTLGETEKTSDLNDFHRAQLVEAYSSAYKHARAQAGAAPLQAAQVFPRNPRQFLQAVHPADLISRAATAPLPAAQRRPLAGP
jgi:hypothetical protein